MEALRLAASRAIWERYHRERALGPLNGDLRSLVSTWDRSRAAGASLEGPPLEEHLLSGGALQDHREGLEPLLVDGADILARAAGVSAERDHVMVLADPEGVVAHIGGGGEFAAHARRLRLMEGATWSESARGTNAIGTAIVVDRTTVVDGAAHYGRRFHDLICHAAPIHDPAGRIIGVLDATSYSMGADPAIGPMISAAVLGLETVARARAWSSGGRSAQHLIARTLDRIPDVGMLVEPSGRIVQYNAAARSWLGPRQPGEVDATLGLDWSALVREALAPTPGGLRLGVGAQALRLRVEPILAADGTLLALALFNEPLPVLSRPAEVPSSDPFSRVIAEDVATRAAIALARRVARSDLPVVLLSETGAGKELFARAIHAASGRAAEPFVAVNCGSLAPQLLESELFGYAPGAFTGADRSGRDGLFQSANRGTLFLDEVAEMPPAMQTALLRVLDRGEYNRVGDRTVRRADVRLICATCRDLPGLVERGEFRRDLFFRLKSVVVTLPPLRLRTDRQVLARHLLGEDKPFSEALVRWIETYDWPGNIRELEAVMSVVRLLGEDAAELDVVHLPPDLSISASKTADSGDASSLAEVESRAVHRTLLELGGNVSAAARRLGVARSTIYRVLRRTSAPAPWTR